MRAAWGLGVTQCPRGSEDLLWVTAEVLVGDRQGNLELHSLA